MRKVGGGLSDARQSRCNGTAGEWTGRAPPCAVTGIEKKCLEFVLVNHNIILWLTIFVMTGIARVIGGALPMTSRHAAMFGE